MSPPRIILIAMVMMSTFCNNREIEFFKEKTGLVFPSKYTVVETYDNYEFIAATIIDLRPEDLPAFISTNGFQPVNSKFAFNLWIRHFLPARHLNFPAVENTYLLSGETLDNTWQVIVDRKRGRVWIEVLYRDWSGTPPG